MKKLLIVVDFQNDFVDGALGFEDALNVVEPIYDKIRAYKKAGNDIIFTRDTHENNYLETQEGKNLPIPHCIRNTKGWEIYGEANQYADIVFDKPTFGSLEMGTYLADKDYDYVELCGLVSNICIISTAVIVKAALPEAKIVVDERLTDSYDKKLHAEALNVMEGFQIKIIRK
ncbi:MAG: cysteine hydrolase [Erysipelothrix sp.]|nr:cysteine hydrolase [Erysipelothrix sp.]